MLTIKNINKLLNKSIIGGWVIRDINSNPTQGKYMLDIHCMGPIGNRIDRCTISLNRNGELQRHMFKADEVAYFFNYNGLPTDVSVTAEWIKNPYNFISQLKYIIKEYHNKR